MYKNVLKLCRYFTIIVIPATMLCNNVNAQVSLTGQLKTRSELRSGYGTLQPTGNSASFFTAQRTRLTFNYKSSKLIFQTSIQDVRLWGQDASTISAADGNKLGVHEAWAEIILSNKKDAAFKSSPFDYFAIKLGRQEIAYDDERLLGALDWTMQARRHDAIVFKLQQSGWQVDLGAAFNQHTDAINYNGTYYTPANIPATVKDNNGNLANTPAGFLPLVNAAGNSDKKGSPVFVNSPGTNALTQNYKAFQYLYAAKKVGKTKFSGLFFADQFGKYKLDSARNVANGNVGYIYGRRFNQSGVNTRITTGILVNPVFGKNNQWAATAGYYYQGGRDKDSLALNAYMLTASVAYKAGKMSYTAGWDYLSGNNAFSTSKTNHRFDPLYGTPHKFWGYMDYFYAVSGAPNGGLSDPYLKVKLTANRFSAELAGHYFMLGADQKDVSGQALNKHLSTELDFTAAYKLNSLTTVDLGLSYMAATRSMEYAKNLTPGSTNLSPVWAYLQINIKPDFLNK
ncbi:alginate export family protein [Mucilaginibacter auburnensis]|uniref:Alginate export protein n=1 Tax=Mucilaginibacter auburnensis TaxID=1457233 RepID=A0A2H9VSK0_9SPHI|nr:alginate export family protein [Mucilaginibacter auburnensis]PJJ83797.1 alginate export protein [Mucilaginibacter auburnensis]